jgi:hypothetical protein
MMIGSGSQRRLHQADPDPGHAISFQHSPVSTLILAYVCCELSSLELDVGKCAGACLSFRKIHVT